MIIEPKEYSVDEVFRLIGEDLLSLSNDSGQTKSDILVDGFHVHPISLRYQTFYQKGIKCACCGTQGAYFKLCGDPDTDRRHFNLYAADGTLMTKDHIIPKCKGGKNNVQNMQTMCVVCNNNKGAYYPGIELEYIISTNIKTGAVSRFRSLEKAVKHILINYKRPSKNDVVNAAIKTSTQITDALSNGGEFCGFYWTKEIV